MATSTAIHALERANIAPRQKSYIMNLLDKATGSRESITTLHKAATKTLESTAVAVRQSAVTAVTAAGLAAVDVYQPEGGLDYNGKYPIDAGVALLGIGASLYMADNEAAPVLRDVGVAALAILSFRKGHNHFSAMHVNAGGTPNGSVASPVPAAPAASDPSAVPSASAAGATPSAAGAGGGRGRGAGGGSGAGFGHEANSNSEILRLMGNLARR